MMRFLIEAPLDRLDAQVELARQLMEQTCRDVLGGQSCRVDADLIRYPDRYMDTKRGLEMWNTVMRSVYLGEFGLRYDTFFAAPDPGGFRPAKPGGSRTKQGRHPPTRSLY